MEFISSVTAMDPDERKAAWRRALLSPLWESNAHSPTEEPHRSHLWTWADIRRSAHEASQLTTPEVVERRVLRLVNPDPSSDSDESTVGNLAAAIQILLPGEAARVHRHSINALRFVLQGEGATTIVNGKPVEMHPGDMLLTPGGCWHEHNHAGAEPVIWLDALDAPLHVLLGISTFERGPVETMPETVPEGAFTSPNVLPEVTGPSQPHSPVFRYPYQDVLRVLEGAPPGRNRARSARYINPITGGAVMSTIDCYMMELEAGTPTLDYSSNASTVCLVTDGEGESWIDKAHHRWSKFDTLSIPQNSRVRHKSQDGARLFCISDREMLRRVDLFRETYWD